MKTIKDLSIGELEKTLKVWSILKKFYFLISLIFLMGLGIKFVLHTVEPFDLFSLVIALHLVYLPFIIEIQIKRKLEERRYNMYSKKANTNKKR